jgi:DNA-binding CsgD family transcriptional regulator
MSEDLNQLVRKYTINHERTIKRICAPLQDLNISDLGYVIIKTDGSFCNLSTFPAFLEYFYAEEMYTTQPYFSHPDLFQSGYTLVQVTSNPSFQKACESRYDLNHCLCKIQKHRDYMEMFFIHPPTNCSKNCLKYLKNIYLLDKFASYFRQEAKTLITNALHEGYNISKTRGRAFHEAAPGLKLLNNDCKTQQFLKKISPLTAREHQCLDLYKQGRSAQATAAILDLSQRTVEHYFDNIKAKLGCQSKMELLER